MGGGESKGFGVWVEGVVDGGLGRGQPAANPSFHYQLGFHCPQPAAGHLLRATWVGVRRLETHGGDLVAIMWVSKSEGNGSLFGLK